MALDVAVPEPPDLSNRGKPRDFELQDETLGSEDFYREDLEDLLQEGAWTEGFNEWAEYTDLDEEQVRIVSDLGLFQAFDFYWDPTDDRLRFDVPTLPDDWRERDATESLDSSTVSMIDAALQDLGRAIHETLEDYLERNEEASDFGWGKETYGKRGE
ncbi:hypothetical protein DU504_17405 [Haloplanus salinus]|jgi:hypothetical protein|uniref:DUF7992 domain-containing protein n=1 Tax=Haloplanus salinus TaxID=1126245 RepID=A0A368N2S1_9EURY|nr:hypothetical protein [Haloplanus salinus]RCU44506.1 hypothetical protein DU504_17405 [Haloplanus salinus]